MGILRNIGLWVLVAVTGASAYDTTIVYSGGRQSGMFKMDGRANMASAPRSDVPDTVKIGAGLVIARVTNHGDGGCILSCNFETPTWLSFRAEVGVVGFRSDADSNVSWDFAVSYPQQIRPLDSIPWFLSPCGSQVPYGFGFAVSGDDGSSSGGGCGDVSTFRALPGYDRILYFRKSGLYLKLQVIGFDTVSTDCGDYTPVTNCTIGDKILLRYVITDDSTGYFGSDPMSLLPRTQARPTAKKLPEAWGSRLYRLILGRNLSSEIRR